MPEIDPEIIKEWHRHPFVREAHRGLQGGSLRDLFLNLHGVLSTLDERFPGIPYRTILDAPHQTLTLRKRAEMQDTMRAAGVAEADIVLVTGPDLKCALGLGSKCNPTYFPFIRSGRQTKFWMAHGHSRAVADILSRLHRPLTERETESLALLSTGLRATEVHQKLGCAASTIQAARWKVQYQFWLEGELEREAQEAVAA